MKNVALHNLGCKVNAYEIDAMQQMLQERGYNIVSFDEIADIYIVNTCSVTNMADRKSRQMLHKAKKKNPNAVVVATGCYVQTGEEQARIDESIDLLVGNNKKKELVPILEAFLEGREKEREKVVFNKTLQDTTIIDINEEQEYEDMNLKQTADHTRVYLKIQDGCNQFCSYCIIPFARGRVRSRKVESILKEVTDLVDAGYQEFVLTGIHLSSYGIDFDGKKQIGDYIEKEDGKKESKNFFNHHLVQVIKQIVQIDGVKRIRLGSLEPRVITKEFLQELTQIKQFCPHFHLSLQSGCDSTLKRMNRRYSASEYYEKVELIRTFFENPAITTDVIVGFPGETIEDFIESKNFLEQVKFFEMHIFKYSKRQGTSAAVMENQVKEDEKTKRSEALLILEKQQSKEYRNLYLKKEVEVLFEEEKIINNCSYQIGHTREYIKVACKTDEKLQNKLVIGKLDQMLTDDIMLLTEEKLIEF